MELATLANPVLLTGIILTTLGIGNRTATIIVGVVLLVLGLLSFV